MSSTRHEQYGDFDEAYASITASLDSMYRGAESGRARGIVFDVHNHLMDVNGQFKFEIGDTTHIVACMFLVYALTRKPWLTEDCLTAQCLGYDPIADVLNLAKSLSEKLPPPAPAQTQP
jgi:hypothetical protein